MEAFDGSSEPIAATATDPDTLESAAIQTIAENQAEMTESDATSSACDDESVVAAVAPPPAQAIIDIEEEDSKASETPVSRKDAIFGRLAQWRKNTPAVENLITTAQRRVVAASAGAFASPLSSAQLSPAHNNIFNSKNGATPAAGTETPPDAANDEGPPSDDDDDDDNYSAAETMSDSGSFVSRSTRTSGGSSSFHLAWAAASVVDSVQTQFRGRYAAAGTARPGSMVSNTTAATAGTSTNPISRSMTTTNTQLSRMLSSTQQQHIQTLVNDLANHEYMMLLGRGMLGVNLKQCYLKNAGVYVDYLVQGGAADQTRHVFVGDLLQKVGSASVEKGTILEIPQQIASAKRPLHLIWATGTPTTPERMTAVDVCVALMHHHRMQQNFYNEDDDEEDGDDEGAHDAESMAAGDVPLSIGAAIKSDFLDEKKSQDEAESAALEQSLSGGSGASTTVETGQGELPTSISTSEVIDKQETLLDVSISYSHSVEGLCNPIPLSLHIRRAFVHLAAKRNHEGFDALDLLEAAGSDGNFYAATRHAFLECVADGRRFPFLARHLSMLEDMNANPDHGSSSAVKSPNAMLMLFCELVNFMDLYKISSADKRRATANRVAYKFFLPTRLNTELVPPMFDFHQIAPDASLRKLENSLQDEGQVIPRDLFFDYATAAMDSLTGYPFLSFMTSPECARMRAYLRNVAPFTNIPLDHVLSATSTNPSAKNYVYFIIVYLLCLTDKEGFGEHDDVLSKGEGFRVEHAVGSITAALFIRSKVLPALVQVENETKLIEIFEQLWEHFIDPNCGALEIVLSSGGSVKSLKRLRSSLENIHSSAQLSEMSPIDYKKHIAMSLGETSMREQLVSLADELVYEYAANVHPKFREHKFHEWLCTETSMTNHEGCVETIDGLPSFASGCIKRLLRKTQFPSGIAPHKPTHIADETPAQQANAKADDTKLAVAECAVIFGRVFSGGISMGVSINDSKHNVQRFCCRSLIPDQGANHALAPEQVPTTLEDYADASPRQQKPFASSQGGCTSSDGWAVSLQSFVVPRADATSESGDESPLFGVSMVFQKVPAIENDEKLIRDVPMIDSPLDHLPFFNNRLQNQQTEEGTSYSIGLALVSQSNSILSMRDTLSRILSSYSSRPNSTEMECGSLVKILNNFRHADVEEDALMTFLKPSLLAAASPWLDQPIRAQEHHFEQLAGQHLIGSLPPIPLALLFITALLEQKIVFTSSRRSLLLSATTALSKILLPLRWCHLQVPCVPAHLAGDLLQYPAPFILGMSTEDVGVMEHIRELPRDVTLVDLDVGRVILAPSFAHDCELGRGVPNNVDTSRALRQQVLIMSQALGNVFGSVLNPEAWRIDVPQSCSTPCKSPIDMLCDICHEFIGELLAGTASCCYWVEESAGSSAVVEPTVLFDEDRFFHVKNLRAREGFKPLFGVTRTTKSSQLAITLEDFDLVLEVFLRCQSMNVYIGSRGKNEMAFSI